MHIQDIFAAATSPTISFEFFPPNSTEGHDRLNDAVHQLSACHPSFVSITYGAGGSTRDATRTVVERIKHGTRLDPIPHFTCVGHQREEIDSMLHHYANHGISNILALRGDAPRHSPGHDHSRDFCTHAVDLVRQIQRFNQSRMHPDARGFGIGVAGFPEGHPASTNRLLEMDHLKAKVDAGADYICTQLFFDNHHFHDFRERCELAGIRVPILAGILPVTSVKGLHRMAELSGRTCIPAQLLKALKNAEGDASAMAEAGLHHAIQQCLDLRDSGVDGIHFYTLNQAAPTLEILKEIGATKAAPT
jgi:methylenetetrahydrofolate reductase (NADPH)